MRISDVIRHKGRSVVTIRSDATIKDLVTLLAEHRIGAVVVSDDPEAGAVAGIVSERDVVRALPGAGEGFFATPISRIMTSDVHTCAPEDEIESVAREVTDRRIRHVPVMIDGRLAGIVSIGDIVKHRIDELQAERDQLTDYIQR
ncbi:CBS domain-containing protein [Luteipulveratus flavus]|uniref:CBS domain-containing protein n=1 Tax=Luteipulveratus flavus TaxID=3031728 RepID=A0ABT6CC66_9MICO|nr:CBS domain-containing protein [Luteipulveratus sp. YIM 133296]MDF8266361.1 CBS domain-containing protein [Luteipulveratus sp. YIM 133296]